MRAARDPSPTIAGPRTPRSHPLTLPRSRRPPDPGLASTRHHPLCCSTEDSPSGLWRSPGTRVGLTPSGVQIPYPPPQKAGSVEVSSPTRPSAHPPGSPGVRGRPSPVLRMTGRSPTPTEACAPVRARSRASVGTSPYARGSVTFVRWSETSAPRLHGTSVTDSKASRKGETVAQAAARQQVTHQERDFELGSRRRAIRSGDLEPGPDGARQIGKHPPVIAVGSPRGRCCRGGGSLPRPGRSVHGCAPRGTPSRVHCYRRDRDNRPRITLSSRNTRAEPGPRPPTLRAPPLGAQTKHPPRRDQVHRDQHQHDPDSGTPDHHGLIGAAGTIDGQRCPRGHTSYGSQMITCACSVRARRAAHTWSTLGAITTTARCR